MTIIINDTQLNKLNKIGKGAEATVYADGGKAYKIFKSKYRGEKQEKIEYMTQQDFSVKNVLFPEDIIVNEQGKFLGYSMPYCKCWGTLAELFNKPMYLLKTEILINIAIKLSELYEKMHSLNISIGDGNPKNFLISADGTEVYLADADSIQIGKYNCKVGVQRYLSPEIQQQLPNCGNRIDQLPSGSFTIENDLFALCNLVFQLLMNGNHAFVYGKKTNQVSSSVSVTAPEQNIYKKESAYFNRDNGILSKDAMNIDDVFTKRFKELLKDGLLGEPKDRPSASLLKTELIKYKEGLVLCDGQVHLHTIKAKECPYCKLDKTKSNHTQYVQTVEKEDKSTTTESTTYSNHSSLWGFLSFVLIVATEYFMFRNNLHDAKGIIAFICCILLAGISCYIAATTERLKWWGIFILVAINLLAVPLFTWLVSILSTALIAACKAIGSFFVGVGKFLWGLIKGIATIIFVIALIIAFAKGLGS